jgi:hypothetical protein
MLAVGQAEVHEGRFEVDGVADNRLLQCVVKDTQLTAEGKE